MVGLADGPIDRDQQAVLFYAYCDDVAGMRDSVAGGRCRGRPDSSSLRLAPRGIPLSPIPTATSSSSRTSGPGYSAAVNRGARFFRCATMAAFDAQPVVSQEARMFSRGSRSSWVGVLAALLAVSCAASLGAQAAKKPAGAPSPPRHPGPEAGGARQGRAAGREAADRAGLARRRDVLGLRHAEHVADDAGRRRHGRRDGRDVRRRKEERELQRVPAHADVDGGSLAGRDAAHQQQPEPRGGHAGRAAGPRARAVPEAADALRRPSPRRGTTRIRSSTSNGRRASCTSIGAAAPRCAKASRRCSTCRRRRRRNGAVLSGAPCDAARGAHRGGAAGLAEP